MRIKRTMVEVELPRYNKEGLPVDNTGTPFDDYKGTTEWSQAFEKKLYYLLHWGIHTEIRKVDGAPVVLTFTVGICQDIETGNVQIFAPEEIRIIGEEMK